MEQFILYGAGKNAKVYYNILKELGKEDVIACFCDQNPELQQSGFLDKEVCSYEEAKKKNLAFFVTLHNRALCQEVRETLTAQGNRVLDLSQFVNGCHIDLSQFHRLFCAKFHVDDMDSYFASAESEKPMLRFWGDSSPFRQMFDQLDVSHVLELACGHGRHVQQYCHNADSITLVDILEKNIEICKERYKDQSHISYYVNNGYDLKDLADNTFTASFCYDAMVHFEMFDIYQYLKELHRVLQIGGLCLLHHSNSHSDPKTAFVNGIQGRSYMSQDIFAYMALRCGFEIVTQQVITWNTAEDLDCISLIRKV